MSELYYDRRQYDRIAARFPVEWSDHYYEWAGECLNFGTGGVYVITPQPLKAGKQLKIRISPPREPELELDGKVAFATSDGMGLAFDVRSAEHFEQVQEIFERMTARDPLLLARLRARVRELTPGTMLYPTRLSGGANATVNPLEKQALGLVGDGKRVDEIARGQGDRMFQLAHGIFALLERGVLTVRQGDAAKPGEVSRQPSGPQAGAPATPSGPRNAQAEKYLQKGKEDFAAGNKLAALTNFKLAIMLAPGDPVILGYLEELDTRKK